MFTLQALCPPCHAHNRPTIRVLWKEPMGKELRGPRERQADLSSSLQKFRPWCWGRMKGVRARAGQGRARQGRVSENSRREGKESKIELPA